MFHSFRLPGFKAFYVHSAFAAVDMNVRMAVHGWLVLELSNDSEFWVGIYALVLGAGQLLFSSFAGALADRFQRRDVLLIEGVLGASLAVLAAAAVYFDVMELWMAIGMAFFVGCLRATRFTATNRFVYDLVGPERLVNGVSLWRIANTPVMIAGSILAGAMIDWVGIWAAYALVAGSLAFSLPFLLFIGVKGVTEETGGRLIRQTIDGLKYASSNTALRTLFTVSIVMEFLGFSFLVMVPVMAKNVLEAGGLGLGYINAGVGGGMFIATLVMAAVGDKHNKQRIIVYYAMAAGLALIGFALSPSLPYSLAFAVLFAGAVMGFLNVYDLTLGVLLQLAAPSHMRGRAVSLHSLAISFTAVGGFFIGGLGSIVTVPVMLAAAGGGIIVNAVWRRSAVLRVREFGAQAELVDTPRGERDNTLAGG